MWSNCICFSWICLIMSHPPAPFLNISESLCIEPWNQMVLHSLNTVLCCDKCVKEVATKAIPQAFSFLCVTCIFSNMSSIWSAFCINWSVSLCQLLKGATIVEVHVCLNMSVSDQQMMMCCVKKNGEAREKDNNDAVKQSCGNSVKELSFNVCDRLNQEGQCTHHSSFDFNFPQKSLLSSTYQR